MEEAAIATEAVTDLHLQEEVRRAMVATDSNPRIREATQVDQDMDREDMADLAELLLAGRTDTVEERQRLHHRLDTEEALQMPAP